MTTKRVSVYSDGSCIGNPGPGGYGVVLDYQGRRKELAGGYRKTTNNRMELLGAIRGLEALTRRCRVALYTDSSYVVNGISKGWARRWRENGWMRDRKNVASNWELWQMLLDLCDRHDVSFHWVRGHDGHPENERCDEIAQREARGNPSEVDVGYERPSDPP